MRAALHAVLCIAAMVLPSVCAPGTQAATPGGQSKVTVGAYINDIQEPDFKANSYALDFYVWFRWRDPSIDPAKTVEFRNRDAAHDGSPPEHLYATPQIMPDGSLYSIIRYRGQFSTKFQLDAYPYDTQILKLVLEDTVLGVDRLLYIPDKFPSVMLDSGITLPGFTVGKPTMLIGENIYPTNFGDLSEPNQETYSRVILSIPVTRPVVSLSIKLFLPIMLVVLCRPWSFSSSPRKSAPVSASASPPCSPSLRLS